MLFAAGDSAETDTSSSTSVCKADEHVHFVFSIFFILQPNIPVQNKDKR